VSRKKGEIRIWQQLNGNLLSSVIPRKRINILTKQQFFIYSPILLLDVSIKMIISIKDLLRCPRHFDFAFGSDWWRDRDVNGHPAFLKLKELEIDRG